MSRFPTARHDLRPSRRSPSRERGHRRELAGREKEERRTFQDRLQASLVDVAVHRAVASRDLVKHQFGGHPFAGRRGIDNLKKAGLVEEHELRDMKVLTATAAGRRLAGDVAPERGWDSEQRTWSGLGKETDLKHDIALYRAVSKARERLAERGLHLRRLRLDAEMRGEIMKRTEAVRAARGRDAADALRQEIAERLDLPLDDQGAILWPDAQIEVAREPDGPTEGRVNIEITTEHYSRRHDPRQERGRLRSLPLRRQGQREAGQRAQRLLLSLRRRRQRRRPAWRHRRRTARPMTGALPLLGTGTGPVAHVVALLMLLVPILVYLSCPCPDRPLDAAQRLLSRLTGLNRDH